MKALTLRLLHGWRKKNQNVTCCSWSTLRCEIFQVFVNFFLFHPPDVRWNQYWTRHGLGIPREQISSHIDLHRFFSAGPWIPLSPPGERWCWPLTARDSRPRTVTKNLDVWVNYVSWGIPREKISSHIDLHRFFPAGPWIPLSPPGEIEIMLTSDSKRFPPKDWNLGTSMFGWIVTFQGKPAKQILRTVKCMVTCPAHLRCH